MTIEGGLIVQNIKIVISETLQQEMVEKVHDNHLGVEKYISQVRSAIYWPAMVKTLKQQFSHVRAV